MGILDDLKNKVEKLGDRAREGFDDARDKAGDLLDDAKDRAGDLVDDAKERIGQHGDERSPLTESSDVGADSSSTDAVQPGYVTAEDDATEDSDESSMEAEVDADEDTVEGDVIASDAGGSDVVPPAAAELDPVDLDAQETDADEAVEPEAVGAETVGPEAVDEADTVEAPAPAVGALVEKDVDPYDQPLTESIGDELANALAAQQAGETDLDAQR